MSTISANTVSLLRFINAFRDPVFLLTSSGRVVCSNAAAREVFEEPPQWLEAAVRSEGSTAFENCGTLCPLVLDGRELFMVLPAVRDHKTSEILARLDELPPSLATVANLLLMGMSDKEVVRCNSLVDDGFDKYYWHEDCDLNGYGTVEHRYDLPGCMEPPEDPPTCPDTGQWIPYESDADERTYDCDDTRALISPGQTGWFTAPVPGGAADDFDYNCNWLNDRQSTNLAPGCPCPGGGSTCGGWMVATSDDIPDCGESALMQTRCRFIGGHWLPEQATVTQGCH